MILKANFNEINHINDIKYSNPLKKCKTQHYTPELEIISNKNWEQSQHLLVKIYKILHQKTQKCVK